MGTRSLGAQISHALHARGVDTVFGIPGVHNVELYRGLEEAGITHVLARHEQGAAFMADGYARATGRPGVCYGISGPGLANMLTPLGTAYADSIPVLAISSCLDDTTVKKGQLHQMLDQVGAAATVCDWSLEARSPEMAYALIDRAFAEFAAARPRPKHIAVPIAELAGMAPTAPAPKALPPAPAPDPDVIARAAQMLRQAKRPLVIAGGGTRMAAQDVQALLQATGAASFTTYQGRGVIPEGPLHAGALLAHTDGARILEDADLILAVGTELAAVDLMRDHLGHNAPLIRIDLDLQVLSDQQGPAEVAVLGDAGQSLAALLNHDLGTRTRDWRASDIDRFRAQTLATIETSYPGLTTLSQAIQAALPDHCMVYSDMTQLAYTAKEVLPAPAPGHWHHPCGFGTLGFALPAAIGGAMARPGLPTICLVGDYGFQFTLQELGTAVELGLSLPIVVWDNGKLKEIEDAMVRAQIPPNAVVAQNPDFCALARAYGAAAQAPKSVEEMQTAIRAAFDAPGPSLIHVTLETLG